MFQLTEITGCTIVLIGMIGFLSYHIMTKLDRIRIELKVIRKYLEKIYDGE